MDNLKPGNTYYTISDADLSTRVAYDVNGDPEYIGQALAGKGEGEYVWQIRKITYVARVPTAVKWAGGNNLYLNPWTGYAGLSYS